MGWDKHLDWNLGIQDFVVQKSMGYQCLNEHMIRDFKEVIVAIRNSSTNGEIVASDIRKHRSSEWAKLIQL